MAKRWSPARRKNALPGTAPIPEGSPSSGCRRLGDPSRLRATSPEAKRFDAIIAVGAVIEVDTALRLRGGSGVQGRGAGGMDTGVVVSFGVLTTDTIRSKQWSARDPKAATRGSTRGRCHRDGDPGSRAFQSGALSTRGSATSGREAALQMLSPSKRAADPCAGAARLLREFPGDVEGRAYAESLGSASFAERESMDERIGRASEHWRLSRMTRVDRNVLRLATWELIHELSTPRAVILDEAVEPRSGTGRRTAARSSTACWARLRRVRPHPRSRRGFERLSRGPKVHTAEPPEARLSGTEVLVATLNLERAPAPRDCSLVDWRLSGRICVCSRAALPPAGR